MAVETRDRLLEPYDLQEGFDGIAYLGDLKRKGIHVDSLAIAVDPTSTKILAEQLSKIQEDQQIQTLIFSSQRIIARRRSRRVVQTLMTRKHR